MAMKTCNNGLRQVHHSAGNSALWATRGTDADSAPQEHSEHKVATTCTHTTKQPAFLQREGCSVFLREACDIVTVCPLCSQGALPHRAANPAQKEIPVAHSNPEGDSQEENPYAGARDPPARGWPPDRNPHRPTRALRRGAQRATRPNTGAQPSRARTSNTWLNCTDEGVATTYVLCIF